MNKRILILTTPFRPNVGGVETHLDDLINIGKANNYKFTVLTYQPLVTEVKGKTVEYGDNFVIYRMTWLKMNLFLKLERYPILEFIYLFPGLFLLGVGYLLVNKSKISNIHAQGLVAGAIGVILGKVLNIPVIISTHSIYNFPAESLYSKFVKMLFNSCDKVLTLSRQSQQEVISLGVEKRKVSIFRYWVDQKIFKPLNKDKARKEIRLPQDSFICLFVGRLVEVKGISQLLEAIKITRKEVIFLIAGDGPMSKQVQAAAKEKSNLLFVGRVDNKRLPLYYNAADVLILPSIHEEGYGRVILEALSCGLPVVGANRGGIKEAITKDVGKLITISPSNIKTILEYFQKNKSKLEILAANARNYAKRHFSEKNAQMILKYYE